MPISFPCPWCAKILKVASAHSGRSGKCPHCAHPLKVPAESEPRRTVPRRLSEGQPVNVFRPATPVAPVPPPKRALRQTVLVVLGLVVVSTLAGGTLAVAFWLDRLHAETERVRTAEIARVVDAKLGDKDDEKARLAKVRFSGLIDGALTAATIDLRLAMMEEAMFLEPGSAAAEHMKDLIRQVTAVYPENESEAAILVYKAWGQLYLAKREMKPSAIISVACAFQRDEAARTVEPGDLKDNLDAFVGTRRETNSDVNGCFAFARIFVNNKYERRRAAIAARTQPIPLPRKPPEPQPEPEPRQAVRVDLPAKREPPVSSRRAATLVVMGDNLAKNGRHKQAREYWQKVLNEFPATSESYQAQQRIDDDDARIAKLPKPKAK